MVMETEIAFDVAAQILSLSSVDKKYDPDDQDH